MIRLPLFIDPSHPAFAGHFPSRPIVPGVVLLDETLRAIAIHRGDESAVACRIGAAKFLAFVGPGETIRLELEPSRDDTRYRMRLFAGPPDDERLAVSGDVSYESTDPASGAD